ncbi:tRNA (adenosine(37)-N6)-dimethylallyltransferase MiaA [Candidatus Daviesbacteria bacterium]|nr:tRNA (adenosine(37)-N6)-dimethylallyltransferase MiaA [Candidatus Daviesbacteria bacterium]
MNTKILTILGPTATGKTDLALMVAKKFNGEIISCDSRQVYKGLDIGTGKMPNAKLQITKGDSFWEINSIKVWMYDMVDPKKIYSVADYVKDANRVIGEIKDRGKLPIIVGGTGLYLRALLEGLDSLSIPIDKKLRTELQKLSLVELQEKLQEVDAKKWKKMNDSDRQNPRRLVRAIELALSNHVGDPSVATLPQDDKLRLEIIRSLSNVLKVGLTAPRDVLYKRVDEHVVFRINQGMIDEAKRLYKNSLSLKRMRQLGLEYGVLADYLEEKIKSKEGLIKILQHKIHGYVRRQLTWFKKEKEVNWFDISDQDYIKKIEKLVSIWYDQSIE